MKKLKVMLYGAVALIASITVTPLMAGSGDFAGPYIAIQGSSLGSELDGSYTDGDGTVTNGHAGILAQVGGAEIGYNIPVSDTLFISIGGTYFPGEAEISKHDDAADAADVKVEASEFWTAYIAPSISVTDNSAVFIKICVSEADISITGDYTCTASSSLEGDTVAIGTKTIFGNGVFIQSEAGLTEYDQIQVNDIATAETNDSGDTDGSGDVKADPSVAYGAITIGYKF